MHSFAAGWHAQAYSEGAFAWSDTSTGAFQDNGPDTYNVRAANGAFVKADGPGAGLTVDNSAHSTNGNGISVYADVSTYPGDSAALLAANYGTMPAIMALPQVVHCAGWFAGPIYADGCDGWS